jgi:hypothetical protein
MPNAHQSDNKPKLDKKDKAGSPWTSKHQKQSYPLFFTDAALDLTPHAAERAIIHALSHLMQLI